MKSTKKLVSLMLALVLLCACVAGCGSNTNNTANNGGQTANGNQIEMQAGDADQQRKTSMAELSFLISLVILSLLTLTA